MIDGKCMCVGKRKWAANHQSGTEEEERDFARGMGRRGRTAGDSMQDDYA